MKNEFKDTKHKVYNYVQLKSKYIPLIGENVFDEGIIV